MLPLGAEGHRAAGSAVEVDSHKHDPHLLDAEFRYGWVMVPHDFE